MTLRYRTGEEIMKGDSVLLSGDPGVIEFVVDRDTIDPDLAWYAKEFGGGVMVSRLKQLGSVFIARPESHDFLDFVERLSPNPSQ